MNAKSKACTIEFYGGSALPRTLKIPAGLRVKRIGEGSNPDNYWIEQFPESVFGPKGSILRHDATHYGVVLKPSQVTTEAP